MPPPRRSATVFAGWLEPDRPTGEQGEPIPWAFSLRLDPDEPPIRPRPRPARPEGGAAAADRPHVCSPDRASADDVVNALDQVLGGVLARQDDSRRWLGLRTFVAGDRAVLVDAAPPALTADPTTRPRRSHRAAHLERRRRRRHRATSRRHSPPRLAHRGVAELDVTLVGLVGLDACEPSPRTPTAAATPPRPHAESDHDDHGRPPSDQPRRAARPVRCPAPVERVVPHRRSARRRRRRPRVTTDRAVCRRTDPPPPRSPTTRPADSHDRPWTPAPSTPTA